MSALADSILKPIRVVHTFRGNTMVYWSVDDKALPLEGVTIEWSRTPNGTWHVVDGALAVNDGAIMDPKLRLYGKELDLYYRVKAGLGGKFVYSAPAPVGYDYNKETWLKYKEIFRLSELTYRANPLAIDVCLLKRRIYGPRCKKCADLATGQRILHGCPVCFDTQVVGGYYPAWHCRMVEGKKTRSYKYANEMSGMDLESRRSGTVIAYPVQVDERDVIVNPSTGERFLIGGISKSGIANTVQVGNLIVVQQFDFDIISSSEVVYNFPLDGCGAFGQMPEEVDPCAEPEPEEAVCDVGSEEERPALPDVPVIPDPPEHPEKDGATLSWGSY
jgi:hypothetical protein